MIAALEVYDPIADEWSQRAPLPEPLAGYALAAHEGRLYLFGGWDGTSYVDSAYVYDAQADAWQTLAPLSQEVGFAAAAALGDAILLAGGYDGRAEYATCRIYRPDEDRYETCASMILPRGGLGLAVDGTSAYAIGGGWERVMTFNERYDSLTGTWSSLTSPIQGQWRTPGVASRGSLIYVVGGWSGGYLDQHEAFQSAFRAFLPLGSRGQQ